MKPWIAIVNPSAGGRRGGARWQAVATALRDAGVAVEPRDTEGPGHGAELALQALRAGHRRVLIVGGDGSAHDVINGVMRAGLPAHDRVTLAIAALGTANDWARSIRAPREPARIAALLRDGATAPHDLGHIEFIGDNARPAAPCWFVNVAGAGFDAQVLTDMAGPARSSLSYLLHALRRLPGYRAARMRIDGDTLELDAQLLTAFVANGAYCGGRMHVAPGARIDDGVLDVVAIRDPGVLGTLLRVPKLYNGSLLRDPLVSHELCKRVRIVADPPVPVEADGQVVGWAPIEVTVAASAIDVAVERRED